ncbi:MAG TPA: hypothetical protein VJW77_16475 [Terriglobia bacterium]|nr:hypothetical protein [Terriglobia bacterium]
MNITAVMLARVLAFIDVFELNPQGAAFYPDLTAGIIERFRFQKYPEKYEDFDESKGVSFLSGTWQGVNVEKLVIYNNGILVDTRVSTSKSEEILDESLSWAADKFNLRYQPSMVRRKRYLSNLIFETEVPILQGGVGYVGGTETPIEKLCERVGRSVATLAGQDLGQYHPIRLDLDFEKLETQVPIAPFSIQRRGTASFDENKYFSEAPLQTDVHVTLLKSFESDVMTA